MPLNSDIKFQKTLALAASASTPFEMEAAEQAARRLMARYGIDPTKIPNQSLYSRVNFSDNPLLVKLRAEYSAAHPRPSPSPPTSVEEEEDDFSYIGPRISFRMEGYTKVSKRGRRRTEKALVTPEVLERMRVLLNSGLGPSAVAEEMGFKGSVNSVRRWRIVTGEWVVDSEGKIQVNNGAANDTTGQVQCGKDGAGAGQAS